MHAACCRQYHGVVPVGLQQGCLTLVAELVDAATRAWQLQAQPLPRLVKCPPYPLGACQAGVCADLLWMGCLLHGVSQLRLLEAQQSPLPSVEVVLIWT